jgi:hypothetical protein
MPDNALSLPFARKDLSSSHRWDTGSDNGGRSGPDEPPTNLVP